MRINYVATFQNAKYCYVATKTEKSEYEFKMYLIVLINSRKASKLDKNINQF